MLITKPVDELVGDNRGILRQKLGRIHCCTKPRDAIRELRADIRNWDQIPKPLRRGFIKCVFDTLAEYKGTYIAVMTGNLG